MQFQLSFRDAQGQTPFMLAISSRSYPAALEIFEYITQLPPSEQQEMIFPKGSSPDHSPLHVLCCNDTCSFTWTGTEHINQVQLFPNDLLESQKESDVSKNILNTNKFLFYLIPKMFCLFYGVVCYFLR